jgi:ribosomal protein S18 acetylase RimI-like enzyme
MITYKDTSKDLTTDNVRGFFVGWPNPPSEETFLRILTGSDEIVLAIDDANGRVVGFINAITDGVLAAYIPLLEVLPEYQGRKIGTELVKRLLDKLEPYYMIDLVCNDSLVGFYERFGLPRATAMAARRFDRQSGIARRA